MGPMQQSEDVIWTDARRSSEIHDLRNLLQVAVSAVSTSRRRIGGPEAELETALDLASAALEKASVFATRLFMPAHVRETPSLPSRVVLRDLEPLIRHAIGDRIALRLSVAPDAPPLSCDQQAFENALLNLVVNARDAMPGGGVLHIGCCACRRCPAELGCCLISLRDTGHGMPAEVAARAFEPHFTTKGAGGSGLGLHNVRTFARRSGGFVELASRPGAGTEVRLHLPRNPDGDGASRAP